MPANLYEMYNPKSKPQNRFSGKWEEYEGLRTGEVIYAGINRGIAHLHVPLEVQVWAARGLILQVHL